MARATFVLSVIFLGLAMPGVATGGLPPDHYQVLARTSQPVPGSNGANIAALDTPTISNDGHVSFLTSLKGQGVSATNDAGLITFADQELRVAARKGDSAVGVGDDAVFSSFFLPNPTSGDRIAFNAGYSVAGQIQAGVWSNHSGNITLVARTDEFIPNHQGDERIQGVDTPLSTPSGDLAFFGSVYGDDVGDDENSVIYGYLGGELQIIAREGDSIATLPNTTFGQMRRLQIVADRSMGLLTELRGPDVNDNNDAALWLRTPSGDLQLIAREGDSIPATGATITELANAEINVHQQAAFIARVVVSPSGQERSGIFLNSNGSLQEIYESPTQLPGLPSGIEASFPQSIMLGNDGSITSTISYQLDGDSGTSGTGIWVWPSNHGEPREIARSGQAAAGLDGVNYNYIVDPSVNNVGQMVFLAALQDENGPRPNDIGVWFSGLNDEPQLYWRTGDQFELEPGVTKTIESFSFFGANDEGNVRAINDQGQFTLLLRFTDKTEAIIVTNPIPVPEPSSLNLILLAIGSLVVGKMRR